LPIATLEIITEMERRAERESVPPPLLQFYLDLLRVVAAVESDFTPPEIPLSEQAVRTRIRRGDPLLKPAAFRPDRPLLRRTFDEVKKVFAAHAALFGVAPEAISRLPARTILSARAIKAWLRDGQSPPAAGGDLDPALVENILRITLRPFLLRYANILLGMVPQELWRRGYCPVCGGSPDISFLEHEYGGRWLVCSRCDSEWLFQRLECAFCGTKDQQSLSYYANEDGRYRLYTCERCKQYLKSVDLRQTEEAVFLPLERLDTLDIDRQAEEMGYRPGIRTAAAPQRDIKAD